MFSGFAVASSVSGLGGGSLEGLGFRGYGFRDEGSRV